MSNENYFIIDKKTLQVIGGVLHLSRKKNLSR